MDRLGVNSASANTNARMDPYATDYEEILVENTGRNMDYNTASAFQQMQKEALRQKQLELEMALKQKYMEEEMIEEELKSLQQPATVQSTQKNSGTRYVQQVQLPSHDPDESTYMYSSIMPTEDLNNEILSAKSMANYVYAKPENLATAENSYYTSNTYLDTDDSDVSRLFGTTDSSSSSYSYGDSSSGKDPVSRFFGITGTTSQDIQLGLTFTVPFLSVPLTSLQSMLGGGGLGDLFDNLSLDSTSIITIVVIVLAAIFVLPQMIYWLTGVNLSAFNWGRSKFIDFSSRFTYGKLMLFCSG